MTIKLDKKRLRQLKINRLRKKYRSQSKRIAKLHAVLKREAYDYPKRSDIVTFGHEKRSSKKGNTYNYLYKQKREKGIKKHEYVAKNLKALDAKLFRRASKEVLESDGNHYSLDGLAPAEISTYQFLEGQCIDYKSKDRDHYAQRYICQLGMRHSKTYGRTFIKAMSIKQKKNILKAARKCFQRHEKIRMKIITMAKNAGIGNNIKDFFAFADAIIILSGGRDTPKRLENYLIKRKAQLENENRKCIYSIFKDSELNDVARDIIAISTYPFDKYANLVSYYSQPYHKMKTWPLELN